MLKHSKLIKWLMIAAVNVGICAASSPLELRYPWFAPAVTHPSLITGQLYPLDANAWPKSFALSGSNAWRQRQGKSGKPQLGQFAPTLFHLIYGTNLSELYTYLQSNANVLLHPPNKAYFDFVNARFHAAQQNAAQFDQRRKSDLLQFAAGKVTMINSMSLLWLLNDALCVVYDIFNTAQMAENTLKNQTNNQSTQLAYIYEQYFAKPSVPQSLAEQEAIVYDVLKGNPQQPEHACMQQVLQKTANGSSWVPQPFVKASAANGTLPETIIFESVLRKSLARVATDLTSVTQQIRPQNSLNILPMDLQRSKQLDLRGSQQLQRAAQVCIESIYETLRYLETVPTFKAIFTLFDQMNAVVDAWNTTLVLLPYNNSVAQKGFYNVNQAPFFGSYLNFLNQTPLAKANREMIDEYKQALTNRFINLASTERPKSISGADIIKKSPNAMPGGFNTWYRDQKDPFSFCGHTAKQLAGILDTIQQQKAHRNVKFKLRGIASAQDNIRFAIEEDPTVFLCPYCSFLHDLAIEPVGNNVAFYEYLQTLNPTENNRHPANGDTLNFRFGSLNVTVPSKQMRYNSDTENLDIQVSTIRITDNNIPNVGQYYILQYRFARAIQDLFAASLLLVPDGHDDDTSSHSSDSSNSLGSSGSSSKNNKSKSQNNFEVEMTEREPDSHAPVAIPGSSAKSGGGGGSGKVKKRQPFAPTSFSGGQ